MAQTPLKVNLKENLRIKDQEAAHLQALSQKGHFEQNVNIGYCGGTGSPNNTGLSGYYCQPQSGTPSADNLKRGRPRADVIGSLMAEGSKTPGNIKCFLCSRVFPREKSLQAHVRTHTGMVS